MHSGESMRNSTRNIILDHTFGLRRNITCDIFVQRRRVYTRVWNYNSDDYNTRVTYEYYVKNVRDDGIMCLYFLLFISQAHHVGSYLPIYFVLVRISSHVCLYTCMSYALMYIVLPVNTDIRAEIRVVPTSSLGLATVVCIFFFFYIQTVTNSNISVTVQ